MQQIGIITDSHSGISQEQAGELGIRVLPMPFYIGEECFYEDVSIACVLCRLRIFFRIISS